VGATGKGVSIAIVDTGIDVDNPEFAGRISAASADVAAKRTIDDEGGHGTMVALTAAAARNDVGVLGIAWEATIMMMRADQEGSCSLPDGCGFFDDAIARGVDRAVQSGAKVINISLGGSPPDQVMIDAIKRASTAGVMVVVAAGNDADDPLPEFDPSQPDPFAIGLREAGVNNVIIAGSVDDSRVMSAFSNPAGRQADWYLTALGDRVCCVYVDGKVKTTTDSTGQQFVYVSSGTSFAAPQIAGAAALLFQAFPNLTGQQVVDLLLRTGDDLGDTGTDAKYGRGVLNIAKAFAPQGTTALAGSTAPLSLADSTIVTSQAMGDALGAQAMQATVLDSYSRAYKVDLGARFRGAQPQTRLASALIAPMRSLATGGDRVALAFSLDASKRAASLPWSGQLRLSAEDARGAQVLAARVLAKLAPGLHFAVGYAQGSDGLVAQMQGAARPAFLVAGDPAGDLGFARGDELGLALRRQLGPWGLTLSGEGGKVWSGAPVASAATLIDQRDRARFTRFGVALDRRWGDLDAALGASWLAEDRTLLGARLHPALGAGGADSVFLDAGAGWRFAPGWRLGGAWRQGTTYARSGGAIAPGSRFGSNGWAIDVARSSFFAPGDSLALRLSQPLRVSSGGVNFDLPVAWSYDTLQAVHGLRRLTLTPRGRETAGEIAWRGPLWGGAGSASVFYRKDPGHYADGGDDRGLALSWRREF